MAALLGEKDILRPQAVPFRQRTPTHRAASDLLVRMELLHRAESSGFAPSLNADRIDLAAARRVQRARDALAHVVHRIEKRLPAGRNSASDLLRLPLFAYPDRLCRRRAPGSPAALMVGGGGVRLAAESAVHDAEFFLALDVRQDERDPRREALVRMASAVEIDWIRESFPESIRTERQIIYDHERDRVNAQATTFYRDLPIEQSSDATVDEQTAGRVLGEALHPRAPEVFGQDESSMQLIYRVALLRTCMPEHPWPAFSAQELGDLLAEAAANRRSLAEIRKAGVAHFLRQRLIYPLDRLLEEHAPEIIEISSGSRIRLNYQPEGKPPILAVRLQELFGRTETPRIANGRVPVLIHLLAPNFRPVQVTSDLASFWRTTYFQVRKDLRVRYPKHAWPEDPLTATPQAKGGRAKSGRS